MFRKMLRVTLIIVLVTPALHAAWKPVSQDKAASASESGAHVLTAAEAATLLPATVFFRGQSATIQARNSGGVQFTKDSLLLVALVDTAGYSSAVQEKYQAYLITEASINIGGHRLEPGAYGCGFIANNAFIVMDIGGHDLFSAPSFKDTSLRRPTPLQVLAGPDGGPRLYVGRNYVDIVQTAPSNVSPPSHP